MLLLLLVVMTCGIATTTTPPPDCYPPGSPQQPPRDPRIPPCGCAICDIPDVVIKYVSKKTPLLVFNTTFYILSNTTKATVVSPNDVIENVDRANKVLSLAGIFLNLTIKSFEDDFLFPRFVLPFCDASYVGDGTCHLFCNVSLTGYDGGDCVTPVNYTWCEKPYNHECRGECNLMQYQWDHGNCCNDQIMAPQTCRDPKSPWRMWQDEKSMARAVNVTAEQSFNGYVPRYADCMFCGASSTFPWNYNMTNVLQQGSVFNPITLGKNGFPGNGTVLIHELGHTFGLMHVFRGAEISPTPCALSCFEGIQYPDGQSGSMTLGDLCSDTRPSAITFSCSDPQGTDCKGQPWTNTPVHNYMGFSYVQDSSCPKEFTPIQLARMRCYAEKYFSNWNMRHS